MGCGPSNILNGAISPIIQAVFRNITVNQCYIGISFFTCQSALEQEQANLFVDIFRYYMDNYLQPIVAGDCNKNEELRHLLLHFLSIQRTDQLILGSNHLFHHYEEPCQESGNLLC